MKIYETDRFYLTPFTRELAKGNYRNWWTDQTVTKYNSHGLFPLNSKELEEFLNSLEFNSKLVWAIMVKKEISDYNLWNGGIAKRITDIHIGNVSLQCLDWINRTAEFAVVIGEKDYWGQGYTTEAARFLFDHGFNKLNLKRIWTGTAITNQGMKGVAHKLAMKLEGTFKNAVFLEGEYIDVVEYGILREEWNQRDPLGKFFKPQQG